MGFLKELGVYQRCIISFANINLNTGYIPYFGLNVDENNRVKVTPDILPTEILGFVYVDASVLDYWTILESMADAFAATPDISGLNEMGKKFDADVIASSNEGDL